MSEPYLEPIRYDDPELWQTISGVLDGRRAEIALVCPRCGALVPRPYGHLHVRFHDVHGLNR